MQHIKATFELTSQEVSDILIATLSDIGYDGFEEKEHELYAYIGEEHFNLPLLEDTISVLGVPYHTDTIPVQNWNALWESNFEPVIVDDFCTIRAHFHDIKVATPYDIVITPKMSFGTGHHATTQLVMSQMRDIDFSGKEVLDFGTGTGILAILAEMLGASYILAIDNDEWSVENAEENITRNGCKAVSVVNGSIEDIKNRRHFNIILANINRHILLANMAALYARLTEGGMLIMSGLLSDDQGIILESAEDQGFKLMKITERNGWISILMVKM